MGNKRKRVQDDQFDQNLERHLESLGIGSVSAYKQWCAENGFSRRLKKSQSDRRKERNAVVNCKSDFHFRAIKRARLSHCETVDKILSNQLKLHETGDKRYDSLCEAMKRLKLIGSQKRDQANESLRKLYQVCELRKVKFLGRSRPVGNNRRCSFVESLANVAVFSNDWIRPLEEWTFRTHNQTRQFESLLDHLFVRHAMPKFFYNVWYNGEFKKGLGEQKQFIHVAAGHSIRRTKLPIEYSKRMSHHFMRAPSDCEFSEALRFGQVLGMGGDPLLARSVLGTELRNEFTNNNFWGTVIKWFIDNPMFDRNMFGVVFDYLNNQKFAVGNVRRIQVDRLGNRQETLDLAEQPNLSMKGRTPVSLLRDVENWHRRLQRSGLNRGGLKWDHSGINELCLTEGEKVKTVWNLRQLLSSAELFREGQLLNHCVASYAGSCFQGRTSIWALEQCRNGVTKKLLTVEVRLPARVICQVRGKSNRLATSEEMRVLSRWASEANLSFASYV